MKCETIKIWGDQDFAHLQTYLLHDSGEFNQHKKRPAVIICPGGAYLGTSDREAEPVALRFAAAGYQAFVLRYNTYFTEFNPDFESAQAGPKNPKSLWPNPLLDLARTISLVRKNADEWFVDPEHIVVCGFSAGGNLAGNLAARWHEPELAEELGVDSSTLKPNAAILCYPVLDYLKMRDMSEVSGDAFSEALWKISNQAVFGTETPTDEQLHSISPVCAVSEKTAPCFIWNTANDGLVFAENSLAMALELSRCKVPYALHIFENGQHGLALADETTASNPEMISTECKVWFDMALTWLQRH